MKNKILFLIIAIAFVGGMFTVAYAGPALTTITLAGDVDILGDLTCTDCIDSADIADGVGSGLDADLLDGFDSVDFSQGPHVVDTDTLGSLGCSTNQIARFDGNNWVCVTQSAKLNPGFLIDSTVDPFGKVGLYTSLAIGTDDLPIISYYDDEDDDLKVAHCTNVSCSTFDTPTTVDSTDDVGLHTSIAIGTDDLPIISYHDFTNGDLKVAHCTNVSCSIFDTPTTVDSTGFVGFYTSIAIGSDNLPIISYYRGLTGNLKVIHCTNVSCSTFDTPTTVDSIGTVGLYTSIAIGSDNLPIISYYDQTTVLDGNLKVAHCTNVSCSTFDTPTTVDLIDDVGKYTSIAIGSDDLPIISYYNPQTIFLDGILKVAHCTNVSCSTFDSPTTVDSIVDVDVGLYSSIAIGTDGLPIISYYDDTNGDLKVAHCSNLTCTVSSLETIDSTGFVGRHTSIAIGTDGLPIISYHDFTDGDLKTVVNGIVLIFS